MGFRTKKTLLEKAQDVAEQVADAAIAAAQDGLEKAAPLIDKGKEIVADAASQAQAQAKDGAAKAAPLLERGKEIVAEAAAQAQERAHEGAEKAAPVVEKGKEAAALKAAAFAALAAGAAESAKAGAQEKVATLTGKPEPKKKGGGFKKFILLTLLSAGVAVLITKLKGNKEADKWQSSYTPPPAPATVPKATPAAPAPEATSSAAVADDNAGADPAEALADAAEAPHEVTTPDAPAEVVEIASAGDEASTDPEPWPHDHLDSLSDPMIASDEPAPYKPGKTGEALE